MQDIEDLKSKKDSLCSECHLSRLVPPEIPIYGPYNTRGLEEGKTYRWCSCGLSKTQPFCDGSHKGTGFSPIKFVAKNQVMHSLCGCKYTKAPPFCDGTHGAMDFDPKYPPCSHVPAVIINEGREDDEDFYIAGVKEMFEINGTAFETEPIDRSFFKRLVSQHNVLMARDARKKSESAGFLLWEKGRNTPFVPLGTDWWNEYLFIADVYVAPTFRRGGVAQRLYQQAEQIAREAHLKEMFSCVYPKNTASMTLQKKSGFTHFATIVSMDVIPQEEDEQQQKEEKKSSLKFRSFDGDSDRAYVVAGLASVYESEGFAFHDEERREKEYQSWKEHFGATSVFCVAEESSQCCGWFSYLVTSSTPYGVNYGEYIHPYIFLEYIYVQESYRRSGIGQRLMQHLMQLARQHHVQHIKSAYVEVNATSAKWHQKQGFQPSVLVYRKTLQ